MIPSFFRIFLLIASLFAAGSCRISLSSTGVSSDARSARVSFFLPTAPLAKPTVGQTFTESLKDILSSQGKLDMVNSGGDLVYEGSVSGYATAPVAIQGNDQAALNRLTITVSLKFTNTKNEKKSFETSFSRYADFSSSQSLSAVEDQLIKDITDQLVQDVFNRTMQDW